MVDDSNPDLTRLLNQWRNGDRSVETELMAAVYPFLRAYAHRQLSAEKSMTMQPTELAHEAYFRLAGQRDVDWQNRGHFFSIAGRLVRRVVIDYLRDRGAEKRAHNAMSISIDHVPEAELPTIESDVDWLRFDQLLTELEQFDANGARIVEMRYFVGMSLEETAVATGVSRATLVRQWRAARAWLHGRLQGHG